MDPILMMDKQREILTNNINSLKETMDLITKRIQLLEEQIKLNEKAENNEVNEIMKENIDEVKNNTNEKKKRGRPKKYQGGNEWAAELNKAEPDKKKEKPKHENKYFSNYKNTFTEEQRTKYKQDNLDRYYKNKEAKIKAGEIEIKKRGRPRKQ